jgi:hypothetical protein
MTPDTATHTHNLGNSRSLNTIPVEESIAASVAEGAGIPLGCHAQCLAG